MERARASGEFCLWRGRRFSFIYSVVLFLSLLSVVTFDCGLVLTVRTVMWLGIMMLLLEPYSGYEIELDYLSWMY